MRSLVTGASGFIGSHLIDRLARDGDRVVASSRSPIHRADVESVAADVLDAEAVERLVREIRPDRIYHLAGQSFPAMSWNAPVLTERVNVEGTLNVLDAMRRSDVPATLILISSSAVYGPSRDAEPSREDDPRIPTSPYGVSKLAAEEHGRVFADRYGMRVVFVRPFAWIGPRKQGDVCTDWVRDAVAIERGQGREIAVGDLDITRDFLDVADGVDALELLAERGESGQAYNVSSGVGTKLADLFDLIRSTASVEIGARVDPGRIRPIDERVKIGDSSKVQLLGWKPKRPLKTTIAETFDFWRAR